MRGRFTVLIAVVGVTVSGSAIAAALAPSPTPLLLRKSDFPTTAKYTWGPMPQSFAQGLAGIGVTGKGAFVSARIPSGSSKYQTIDGAVVTAASSDQARKVFGAFKSEMTGGKSTAVRLPAYGEQQLAYVDPPALGSRIEVLVRRNRVVWQLEVVGGGLLVLPKEKLISELKKYAKKQQTRVGAG